MAAGTVTSTMRVLVLGGSGYVGQFVIQQLLCISSNQLAVHATYASHPIPHTILPVNNTHNVDALSDQVTIFLIH